MIAITHLAWFAGITFSGAAYASTMLPSASLAGSTLSSTTFSSATFSSTTLATATFHRLLFCLVEGLALAVLMTGVLCLAPGKDSRTRFRVWFSTLLATAALPLLTAGWTSVAAIADATQPVFSVPVSVVEYVCLAWLIVAMLGLLRVAAGLWQLRKLRSQCQPIGAEQLGAELASRVEEFRKLRPLSIVVSQDVHVPAAVGFFHPAIVLPAWLAAEGPSDELKHVVLHELEHLRRYDDWTNLAQQIVKAVLFFHPAVWWMERELTLDREMACDDAVLAQTSSPRAYALCLARVAEKSFLQRQLALAQAAVSRVRQLSQRVARILDANRPAAAPLWKPAIPLVAALALLCAFGLSWTPSLIAVNSGASSPATMAAAKPVHSAANDADKFPSLGARVAPVSLMQAADEPAASPSAAARSHRDAAFAKAAAVKAVHRSLRNLSLRKPSLGNPSLRNPSSPTEKPVLRSALTPESAPESLAKQESAVQPESLTQQERHRAATLAAENRFAAAPGLPQFPALPEVQGDYVLVVATEQTITRGPAGWQVNFVEVRMLVPKSQLPKPFPKKT